MILFASIPGIKASAQQLIHLFQQLMALGIYNQLKEVQFCTKCVCMYAKILILLNLAAFAFVVSQPLFYLLALSHTQKKLQASSYIELRQLLDKTLQVRLSALYYITLGFVVTLVVFALVQASYFVFVTSLIALVALLIDVTLALKTNIPINKIINRWDSNHYPRHWQLIRRKWFYFFGIRQVAGIVGFASLLVGAVFG